MPYQITRQPHLVEVHMSGKMSHWDVLGVVFKLYKQDPGKETPDLWILDSGCEFSLYSFPPIVQGILKLATKTVKKGCRSAILAADEFQRLKMELYCAEAKALPYEVRAFTDRGEALDWLGGA